jgi:hypothetical protein
MSGKYLSAAAPCLQLLHLFLIFELLVADVYDTGYPFQARHVE